MYLNMLETMPIPPGFEALPSVFMTVAGYGDRVLTSSLTYVLVIFFMAMIKSCKYQPKVGRVCFGLQFEDAVHHGRYIIAVGEWMSIYVLSRNRER